MESKELCTLEKRGNIFLLTLTGNDDHRLHPNLIDSISAVLRRVRSESTSSSSALITTAQGKYFSNGYDLKWALVDKARQKLMSRKLRSLVSDLITLPMPTIAAVTGHASAGGFVFALCHDYILMRKDRGFLYMSELDIGFPIPIWFSAVVKCRMGSPAVRREVVMKAAKVTAEMGVQMGFVDSAHSGAEETVEAAIKLGEELVSRNWDGKTYAGCRKTLFLELLNSLGSDESVGDYGDEEANKTLAKLSSLSSTPKNQSLLKYTSRTQLVCSSSSKNGSDSVQSSGDNNTSNFCIIEGPETVQDFGQMQFQEIQDNIRSRRNKIFLLMEEVRRLRIQQRLKNSNTRGETGEDENEMPDIPSTIPFLPNMTPKTLKQLYLTSFSFIAGIMVFGGLLAPILELKLGLGGTSYEDFIRNMHLPMQLSQVDPIVASFSGGAVGVISALMLIEANNVVQQEKKKCKYCYGSGYLACARCSASGKCLYTEPISVNGSYQSLRAPTLKRCANCSGIGKVMCPTCLCTGMVMASEHDLRIDPFD